MCLHSRWIMHIRSIRSGSRHRDKQLQGMCKACIATRDPAAGEYEYSCRILAILTPIRRHSLNPTPVSLLRQPKSCTRRRAESRIIFLASSQQISPTQLPAVTSLVCSSRARKRQRRRAMIKPESWYSALRYVANSGVVGTVTHIVPDFEVGLE
jgi:hypothetical protein